MARRKRLELPTDTFSPDLETQSAFPPRTRMPIADVAGDTAGRAALEEVAHAPNSMMAAEMAIIRMTHVADLPSPEDLIRKLQNEPLPTPPAANCQGWSWPSTSAR